MKLADNSYSHIILAKFEMMYDLTIDYRALSPLVLKYHILPCHWRCPRICYSNSMKLTDNQVKHIFSDMYVFRQQNRVCCYQIWQVLSISFPDYMDSCPL